MKRYYVYFYYNNKKELLYVGKTIDVRKRWREHQEKWKGDVHRIGIREYPDHASMDVFEHYYIARFVPKYNKEFLHHGGTRVEISDPITETLYTIEEFKQHYSPVEKYHHSKLVTNESTENKTSISTARVIECSQVNLFDEKLLLCDLNNTRFKFRNMFFEIGYRRKREGILNVNHQITSMQKALGNENVILSNGDIILEIGRGSEYSDLRKNILMLGFIDYKIINEISSHQLIDKGCIWIFNGIQESKDKSSILKVDEDAKRWIKAVSTKEFTWDLKTMYEILSR